MKELVVKILIVDSNVASLKEYECYLFMKNSVVEVKWMIQNNV